MKEISMVKIIVDKVEGHIVYLRYFEEMKDDRMETLVFDLDSDSGNLKITNLDRLVFTKNGEFMI